MSNGGLSSDVFPVWNTQGINETTKVCIRQEQGHPLNTYSTVALPSSYHTAVCSDGVERHLASPSLPCCSQWPRGAFGRILVMAVSDREIRAHSRRPQETAAEKLESVLSERERVSVACQPVSVDMLGLVGRRQTRRKLPVRSLVRWA